MVTVAEAKAAAAKKKSSPTKAAPAKVTPIRAEPAPEPEVAEQPAIPKGRRTTLADLDETVNILYYGDGGTGKTTDLASMANLGKVVMVNAESGIKAKPLRKLGIKTENIEVVPGPGEALTFNLLEDLFWELTAELAANPGSLVGVCWDSITEIYKVLLKNVVDHRVEKANRTGKGSSDPFFTDRQDWGIMIEQIRVLVRRYRDLPVHFGASALERRDVDDDGKVIYRPSLTPALQTDVYGYMDMVCHTEVRELDPTDLFIGTFRPVGKFRAKDRFSAAPHRLVEPTFQRVLGYVMEDLEEGTDPVMEDARKRLASQAAPEGADSADE